MKTLFLRLFLVLGALTLALPAARAENLRAVKARMEARLNHLDMLKSKGAVGENNRGYVEVRDGGSDAASVVAAENADREAVYTEIAKENNRSVDAVARSRARKIAKDSASGVWVQKDDDTWVRK